MDYERAGIRTMEIPVISGTDRALTATEPSLEVYNAAELVSREIEILAKLVKSLEERLAPVLSAAQAREDRIASTYQSPLANRISSFYDFIYNNNGVLRDLLDRLQI
jgi:hypothetical protein